MSVVNLNRRSSEETTQQSTLGRSRSIRHFAFAVALLTGCAGGSISAVGESATNADDEQDEVQVDEDSPVTYSDAGAAPVKAKNDASTRTIADAGTTQSEVPDTKSNTNDGGVSQSTSDAGSQPTSSANNGKPAGAYKVQNGKIFDGCGEELVMRGVNHPTIYTDRAGAAFPEIAKTGANTVRLFWFGTHGVAVNELEGPVGNAVKNGLLPILEMHDSTCKWDVDPIIEQWIKPEMVAFIKKHEQHLIVNIANEASYPNGDEFVSKYKTALTKMRGAGIHTPLIIDAGRCGRDYDTLLNRGKELLDFDPDHNVIFSAHLYDAKPSTSYAGIFAKAKAMQIPFIVGEFANKEPPGCGADIDYKSLISEANKAGYGWLAWSWGDNDPNSNWNTDCALFDMTSTFAFDTLKDWGKEVSVDNSVSIKATAKRPYALQHGDTCQ
ncbi:MAG TPA: cellulase family glycosylhydrolase [Polyangiales bacterium]|nr:cellulase family glycosylhydrolase [Polyangiales bacterium]